MERITKEDEMFAGLDKNHHSTVNAWLERGDGVAIYENQAFDSSNAGHLKYVSYGSASAQIETEEPPQRLPDIGSQVNWAYQLIGRVRREIPNGD